MLLLHYFLNKFFDFDYEDLKLSMDWILTNV